MGGSEIYVGVHVGLAVAILLFVGGLTALYRSIPGEPGAAWARLGFVGIVVGAAMGMASVGVDIATEGAADAWAAAPETERLAAFRVAAALLGGYFAMFSLWVLVSFGVTFILYGLAVGLSTVYPRWLGWAAVVGGVAGVLVGLDLLYRGPTVVTLNILFTAVALFETLWALVIGVLMGGRAGAAG
jgi:hypothetical protein